MQSANDWNAVVSFALDADILSSKEKDIKNKRLDVKATIHFPKAHLLVNYEAHHKGKNVIDKYWFIYILDKETAEFYFVDYDDLTKWENKVMGHTKAYYIKREQL